MNFFAYWTNQIAPYAEKASPFLSLILLLSFVVFWMIRINQVKKQKNLLENTDWSKIPMSIFMLIYTFQWAFVPDFGSIFGDILVVFFVATSMMWLLNHYQPVTAQEVEKSDDKED